MWKHIRNATKQTGDATWRIARHLRKSALQSYCYLLGHIACTYNHHQVFLNKTSWHTQLDGCIVWNVHYTVFGSKRSALYAQLFTSCIWRWLVSRACDWVMSALSAVLLIYSFQFRPAFLPRWSARRHSSIRRIPISDIGRRRKFWEVSCTERTRQAWLWIDSNSNKRLSYRRETRTTLYISLNIGPQWRMNTKASTALA